MRLDTFLIADAATAIEDGKFYIHGGGISRLELPVLPCPMLFAVFVRLEVSEEELRQEHRLAITLFGPTGNPNIPPVEVFVAPKDRLVPLLDGEQRFVQAALPGLPALAIRVGLYHLQLDVDGRQMGSIPLPVALVEPDGPEDQSQGQLSGRSAGS